MWKQFQLKIVWNSFNFDFILVIHTGVTCIMCEIKSIKGILYTCLVCPDFMACENCEKSAKYEHTLFEITSKYNQKPNPESQYHLSSIS